jgi:hypothetical protein
VYCFNPLKNYAQVRGFFDREVDQLDQLYADDACAWRSAPLPAKKILALLRAGVGCVVGEETPSAFHLKGARMSPSGRISVMLGMAIVLSVAAKTASAQVPQPVVQLGASITPVRGPAPGQGPAVLGGLRVNYTLPGYSAHGLLFPGDVLHGGWDGFTYFPLLTTADIEAFKSRVGIGRWGALHVYRPGAGAFYVWVTFTSVNGGFLADFRPGKTDPAVNAKAKGNPKATKQRQEKGARRK